MLVRRREGFTLIELLVVIAIIAILAAILFPVFATARERARTASCALRIHQLAKAVKQYAQDFTGYFPPIDRPGGRGWDGGTKLNSWVELAVVYVSDTEVAKCPSQIYTPLYSKIWGCEGYLYGYAINSNMGNDTGGLDQLGLGGDAVVRYPAQTLLIGDGNWSWFAYDLTEDWTNTNPGIPNWWSNKVAWRHPRSRRPRADYERGRGRSNFAMVDGHVKLMPQPNSNTYNVMFPGYYLYP